MTSLSPSIQSVLELFKGPLGNVRFADIDAEGLTRAAAEVEAASSEVQQHEEQLASARLVLAQRQEVLLGLAQQALAYARVYAENDEPLLEELNRISLPRASKPRKPGAANTGARAARTEPAAEATSPAEALPADALPADALPADASAVVADVGDELAENPPESGDQLSDEAAPVAREAARHSNGKHPSAKDRNGRKAKGRSAHANAR